jgi:hypothetical protein
MRHYYGSAHGGFVESVGPEGGEAAPRSPALVSRERVPGLIDGLDCLLALWIAESIVDNDSADADRPPRNPHEPPSGPEIPTRPGDLPSAPPEDPVPPGPPDYPGRPSPPERGGLSTYWASPLPKDQSSRPTSVNTTMMS